MSTSISFGVELEIAVGILRGPDNLDPSETRKVRFAEIEERVAAVIGKSLTLNPESRPDNWQMVIKDIGMTIKEAGLPIDIANLDANNIKLWEVATDISITAPDPD